MPSSNQLIDLRVVTFSVCSGSGKKLVDFERALDGDEEIQSLRVEVQNFAGSFAYPETVRTRPPLVIHIHCNKKRFFVSTYIF